MKTSTKAARKPIDRQLRALQQADDYVVFETVGTQTGWTVQKIRGEDAGTSYQVDTTAKTCTCMDFEKRKLACKHQHLVNFHVQAEAPAPVRTSQVGKSSLTPERRAQVQAWMKSDFSD